MKTARRRTRTTPLRRQRRGPADHLDSCIAQSPRFGPEPEQELETLLFCLVAEPDIRRGVRRRLGVCRRRDGEEQGRPNERDSDARRCSPPWETARVSVSIAGPFGPSQKDRRSVNYDNLMNISANLGKTSRASGGLIQCGSPGAASSVQGGKKDFDSRNRVAGGFRTVACV